MVKPPVHSIRIAPPDHLEVRRLKEPRFIALYDIFNETIEKIDFEGEPPQNIEPLKKKALAAVKRALLA